MGLQRAGRSRPAAAAPMCSCIGHPPEYDIASLFRLAGSVLQPKHAREGLAQLQAPHPACRGGRRARRRDTRAASQAFSRMHILCHPQRYPWVRPERGSHLLASLWGTHRVAYTSPYGAHRAPASSYPSITLAYPCGWPTKLAQTCINVFII